MPGMTESIAFTVPILPGKTERDREVMRSCWQGERQADHQASRRRMGITRESVWLQPTPGGDVAIVFFEADELAGAFDGLATSQDPFDAFFREYVLDVHGVDLTQGFPPPEQVLDHRA